MPRQPVSTRVDFKGPFFQGRPSKKFRENARDMLAALAVEMERDVRGQTLNWPPEVREHIYWYVRSTRSRRLWQMSSAVGISTEGLSNKDRRLLRARAVGLETKYHPFRRTYGAANRAKAIYSANLTKGLE